MNINDKITNQLDKEKERDSYRSLVRTGFVGGKEAGILNFSSNDYLNFSVNNELKEAAQQAVDKYGTTTASSRLLSGNLSIHESLEEKTAEFFNYDSALVFGSGYLTNVGVISGIADKNSVIITDKLVHASIIDAVKLSSAKHKRFKHNDMESLKTLLDSFGDHEEIIIITESVFSMDGDIADIEKISRLAKQYNAFTIIDEAHAVGVYGKNGRGICSDLPDELKPDIVIGTFGKALAGYGGFALCSELTKKYLINKARSFIYSTSLPPSVICCALKAIELLEDNTSGEELINKADHFRQILNNAGIGTGESQSQIVPVIIGDNKAVISISESLSDDKIIVKAIRPPTVPENTSRLRFSITMAHELTDLEYTAEKLIKYIKDSNE
ncbi:MAG: aminotransferase class I/II-fold pyridoxal phosphate-dependent enzyme [Planctomycetota bacterium]|jgi:8-amino-7-oxononanoate synthase